MKNPTELDLSSFKKAIASLDEAIQATNKDKNNKLIRDGMIQRFEYTYELCHKMLRRFLESSEPNADEIEQMSFPNLIRTGSERGLLSEGWDVWNQFRDARNITSHTCDDNKASKIALIIPNFFTEADFLFHKLQERISQ